jgi:hypothetical protein
MRSLMILLALPLLAFACSDDTSPSDDDDGNGGTAANGGGGQGGSEGGQGGDGGSAGGGQGGEAGQGGEGGGGMCVPPTGAFDGNGCLTFASASEICGFNSDGEICAFAVGCGASADEGQCKINCEMGTTVNCYHQEDIDCLHAAAQCDDDCAALPACGWIL